MLGLFLRLIFSASGITLANVFAAEICRLKMYGFVISEKSNELIGYDVQIRENKTITIRIEA